MVVSMKWGVQVEKEVIQSTVFLNETDVYYQFGEAKGDSKGTLILIHGFVSSCYCFRKIIPILQKHYDVYAIDLPGFGRSGKRKDFEYSFHNYANVIISFCHLFRLTNVMLVGHSMGGQVALYTALQEPNLVSKMILMSSSGYLKRVRKPLVYASYLPFAKSVMRRWIEGKDYKQSLLQVVYNKKLIDQETITEYTRPFSETQFFDALLGLMRHREGDLSREDLNHIDHPILLIWGEEDQVIPIRIGRRLSVDLPNAVFTSIKKTGHLVPEEKPDQVTKLIFTFIENEKTVQKSDLS
ncbi:alpha/beta hydrolase [Halalkalibacter sp. APA_J-10(15)]|uniref:alpha/beta hydrolase n=1 Tax=Halalkalibacter sp. APA_J-10(15) TaxID=2933805 RepID=UPI001FF0E0A6|nr:alpha/beta hydrolase [Halalkalibacter sp. APA_J-10(15)]MCK0471910.1 alpha/beta hydrolase [Halalkalibacter sp. APA_J-10(15)]